MKEDFITLHQNTNWTDFDELWATVSALNEDKNSLLMSESRQEGWFVMHCAQQES